MPAERLIQCPTFIPKPQKQCDEKNPNCLHSSLDSAPQFKRNKKNFFPKTQYNIAKKKIGQHGNGR